MVQAGRQPRIQCERPLGNGNVARHHLSWRGSEVSFINLVVGRRSSNVNSRRQADRDGDDGHSTKAKSGAVTVQCMQGPRDRAPNDQTTAGQPCRADIRNFAGDKERETKWNGLAECSRHDAPKNGVLNHCLPSIEVRDWPTMSDITPVPAKHSNPVTHCSRVELISGDLSGRVVPSRSHGDYFFQMLTRPPSVTGLPSYVVWVSTRRRPIT